MKRFKPLIGVLPLWDEEKKSLWMLPGYLEGIREAGGLPFVFPFTSKEEELRQLLALCEGVLFTGGQDVSPGLYQEAPLEGLIEGCEKRDEMEGMVLSLCMEEDKPILGICRGIQFINVAMGGTLYQDLPLQHPSEVDHRQSPPYDLPIHEVRIAAGTPLKDCLGREIIGVNSCHHQAVKDLAPGLKEMATSPDGLVEAVYRPESRFLWAVQWHPEFSHETDENSSKIFRAFVEACSIE